jgi:hypothetical protein
MTCILITYLVAAAGSALGFFVANLLHVGGRS